jgi:hypothetical protein
MSFSFFQNQRTIGKNMSCGGLLGERGGCGEYDANTVYILLQMEI